MKIELLLEELPFVNSIIYHKLLFDYTDKELEEYVLYHRGTKLELFLLPLKVQDKYIFTYKQDSVPLHICRESNIVIGYIGETLTYPDNNEYYNKWAKDVTEFLEKGAFSSVFSVSFTDRPSVIDLGNKKKRGVLWDINTYNIYWRRGGR
ncbi:hypothetical protein ThvES_00017630 [Thiovulum sp. ES]|nr:hypothetical protein ThvES_00017630 [Thiovulum sp. ES]